MLGISIGGTPVSAEGFSITPADPNLRLFNLTINPGEKKNSTVLIENVSDEPITLFLYGADGTQSNQGTFALTTRATEQQHIGQWVKFAGETVTVEPHRGKEVAFTVTVPVTATPGVYSGGIAAESGGKPDLTAGGGNAISISARIVVKLFVTVPGMKVNRYEWSDFSFKPSSNGAPGTFNLTYKNTGNTVIMASQTITVKGFPGREETFELTPAMLLQGGSVDIPVKWKDEPFFGFYTATANAKFSEYDITSNTRINGKEESRSISVFIPLKMDTNEGKLVVGAASALIALILIFLLLTWLRISFRKQCVPYVVAEGDSIVGIAESRKVGWRKLAKVNKLKAPYTIKPGQKILAPPQKNDIQKK
jgi:hypothetical protein